jgi:hypothetical protein
MLKNMKSTFKVPSGKVDLDNSTEKYLKYMKFTTD